MARVVIPDTPVGTETEFASMMTQVRASIEGALATVLACSPGAVILGMSAETFWEGVHGRRVRCTRTWNPARA